MNKEINSLYRTYRPKDFSEVVGQQHVTKTLQNQIANDKIAHAYLFCGTRGTGKTSIAKIFAREVNKIKGQEIFNQELDIFEIDAASNNSVQDVRELIDKVKYPPVASKYKVYIIDEVHMFSSSAFNAFLKTLEEPPSHVIFILCTTEAHKLLPTVQSRCLRFDFRSLPEEDIEKHLENIFKKEKIEFTTEAIKQIAKAGEGSIRDALSLSETVIAYCGENKVTEKDVSLVLGTVGKDVIQQLLEAIKQNKPDEISKTCNTIFSKGLNPILLVKSFLDVVCEEFIKTKDKSFLNIYKIFSEIEINMKNTNDAKAMFEGGCLLCLIPV